MINTNRANYFLYCRISNRVATKKFTDGHMDGHTDGWTDEGRMPGSSLYPPEPFGWGIKRRKSCFDRYVQANF